MTAFINWVIAADWGFVLFACLTLGLAPFTPPHIVEKIQMLASGTLKRPIDWFDLFFHAIPWIVLILKVVLTIKAVPAR